MVLKLGDHVPDLLADRPSLARRDRLQSRVLILSESDRENNRCVARLRIDIRIHYAVVWHVVRTQSRDMKRNFRPGTSQFRGSARTFALQMALDKEAMAERLRELRGPKPQQAIADAVGVTLRAYQAWEGAESGMHWENLERLAEVFDVSENFLLYGLEAPAHGAVSQLDRIEQMLEELDEQIRQLRIALLGREMEELPQSAQEAAPTAASRRRRRPAASA